nr:MAG: putative capsid protein [Picornavirales sp.]
MNFTMGRNISNYFAQANGLSSGNQALRNLPMSEGNLQNRDLAESGESAGEGAGADALGPEAALIQMAQNAGAGLNDLFTTIDNNRISNAYQTSLNTGHGIGLTEQAMNTATAGYANSSLKSAGGKFGATIGGPAGALIGRGLASFFETKAIDAVAYSPTGSFNPQNGSTNQSQSARVVHEEPNSPVVMVDSASRVDVADESNTPVSTTTEGYSPTPEESTSQTTTSSSTGFNILC